MTNGVFNFSQKKAYGDSADGYVVLENFQGRAVRSFRWDTDLVYVVYRHDNRRVETVKDLNPLKEGKIKFDVLSMTSREKLKSNPVVIPGGRGKIRWVQQIAAFSDEHELAPEINMEPKIAFGWSVALQLAGAGVLIIAGLLSGSSIKSVKEAAVVLIPQEAIEKILAEKSAPARSAPIAAVRSRQTSRKVVVSPSLKKIQKNAPIPTRSTSFKRDAGTHTKGLRGGGYKGKTPRGYGTNERHMNEIGALAALNQPRVKGSNGGRGGLNLQAVGTEPGSGAGGKGFGGFGQNGRGGKGRGGLGTGQGQGLANAMYGKGLVAAPFGDGSPAPGVGGYGTRGKMGGGAQGAGYGQQTVVGSWKGTGPKGNGPAGSGVGNGDPNGSPWGTVDGDDSQAVVTGGLDMDAIREIINRNMGQIRYCYEQGLQTRPTLAGRVTVRWQIDGSGRVSTAAIRNSSVGSSQVDSCIVSKITNWKFPKPHGGVNVSVVYPFNLQRTVSMK